jgi:hypothetical protein
MPVPTTVQERDEERLMHRLRLLLQMSDTIVEGAEGRCVTNRGVIRHVRPPLAAARIRRTLLLLLEEKEEEGRRRHRVARGRVL